MRARQASHHLDRLTRSLADFSKMVEVFERYGVSFASVTQQFNTTTSMGRLMLNILLSFAQFEREVTGERIRDKIAASKRKGMWMGGVPPLGYDVENCRLVPNDRELWDKVHAILATNGRVRGNATRATVPYLLKGIVFGNDGRALSPFHTTKKNGRRYRYYVPQRENKEHAGASGLPRLPAAELESAVLDQLRAVLRSPDLLGDVLLRAIEFDPSLDEATATVAMTRLDTIWDQLFRAEQTRIVKLLVEKVIVSPNDLEVRLRANGIERLVLELQPAGAAQPEEALA